MVQNVKLTIYRDSLSMYYSSGNGNSFRHNFGINLSSLSEKEKNKLKTALKRNDLTDELSLHKHEVQEVVNYSNTQISLFKIKYGRKPSIEEFKEILRNRTAPSNEKNGLSFLGIYEEFLNEKREQFLIINKTPNSLKDFISFKNSFIDMELSLGRKLKINEFDYQLVKKYFDFLYLERPKNLIYLTQGKLDGKTIKKRFDTLKNFFSWVEEMKDIDVDNTHKAIRQFLKKYPLQKITKDVKKYSLSVQEVRLIIDYPTENLPSPEQKAREMFLVAVHTGMRISDLISLSKENITEINEVKYVIGKTKKTNKPFQVEINDFIFNIIQRNNFNMKLMSEQKGNHYLKKFLSRIPAFQVESIYFDEKSQLNPKRKLKVFELISFHQARRTFTTNLLDDGRLSIVEVMARTGHSKVSTLEKYVSPKGSNDRKVLDLYLPKDE